MSSYGIKNTPMRIFGGVGSNGQVKKLQNPFVNSPTQYFLGLDAYGGLGVGKLDLYASGSFQITPNSTKNQSEDLTPHHAQTKSVSAGLGLRLNLPEGYAINVKGNIEKAFLENDLWGYACGACDRENCDYKPGYHYIKNIPLANTESISINFDVEKEINNKHTFKLGAGYTKETHKYEYQNIEKPSIEDEKIPISFGYKYNPNKNTQFFINLTSNIDFSKQNGGIKPEFTAGVILYGEHKKKIKLRKLAKSTSNLHYEVGLKGTTMQDGDKSLQIYSPTTSIIGEVKKGVFFANAGFDILGYASKGYMASNGKKTPDSIKGSGNSTKEAMYFAKPLNAEVNGGCEFNLNKNLTLRATVGQSTFGDFMPRKSDSSTAIMEKNKDSKINAPFPPINENSDIVSNNITSSTMISGRKNSAMVELEFKREGSSGITRNRRTGKIKSKLNDFNATIYGGLDYTTICKATTDSNGESNLKEQNYTSVPVGFKASYNLGKMSVGIHDYDIDVFSDISVDAKNIKNTPNFGLGLIIRPIR
ncbi:hypothetical protein J6R97_00305 [bacterium]|nr:hypothetical protein [bacterium]